MRLQYHQSEKDYRQGVSVTPGGSVGPVQRSVGGGVEAIASSDPYLMAQLGKVRALPENRTIQYSGDQCPIILDSIALNNVNVMPKAYPYMYNLVAFIPDDPIGFMQSRSIDQSTIDSLMDRGYETLGIHFPDPPGLLDGYMRRIQHTNGSMMLVKSTDIGPDTSFVERSIAAQKAAMIIYDQVLLNSLTVNVDGRIAFDAHESRSSKLPMYNVSGQDSTDVDVAYQTSNSSTVKGYPKWYGVSLHSDGDSDNKTLTLNDPHVNRITKALRYRAMYMSKMFTSDIVIAPNHYWHTVSTEVQLSNAVNATLDIRRKGTAIFWVNSDNHVTPTELRTKSGTTNILEWTSAPAAFAYDILAYDQDDLLPAGYPVHPEGYPSFSHVVDKHWRYMPDNGGPGFTSSYVYENVSLGAVPAIRSGRDFAAGSYPTYWYTGSIPAPGTTNESLAGLTIETLPAPEILVEGITTPPVPPTVTYSSANLSGAACFTAGKLQIRPNRWYLVFIMSRIRSKQNGSYSAGAYMPFLGAMSDMYIIGMFDNELQVKPFFREDMMAQPISGTVVGLSYTRLVKDNLAITRVSPITSGNDIILR